ncbi:MAG TPA: VOC family protein [Acidimicrobiia bacterium]|nr:VOC family protein [Acidimicrobiia bacterium]
MTARPPVRPVHVVIDAADVDVLRDFWVAALGYEAFGAFEQYRSAVPPAGTVGPKFVFQQVAEARAAGKNRLHLDLEVGDEMEAEADRLVALGATRRGEAIVEDGTSWIVMADPEGNEFCLVHH